MVSKKTAELYLNSTVVFRLKDKNITLVGKIILITEKELTIQHPRFGKSTHSLSNISEDGFQERKALEEDE